MSINVLRMTKRKKDIVKRDSEIKEQHFEDIEFVCPVKGKIIQKKVLVTTYKPQYSADTVRDVYSRGYLSELLDNKD